LHYDFKSLPPARGKARMGVIIRIVAFEIAPTLFLPLAGGGDLLVGNVVKSNFLSWN